MKPVSTKSRIATAQHLPVFIVGYTFIKIIEYCTKKALKTLGLYNIMCRTFLLKRKFIVEPFVYIDEYDEIVKNKITGKILWLEKFEIETQCIEFAKLEFWQKACVKYGFCDAIWLF